MSARLPTPGSLPPEPFNPEKFSKKSTLRDYVTYAFLLAVLLGLVGGGIYYSTRPDAEKDKLLAKLDQTLGRDAKKPAEPPRLSRREIPELEGLLGKDEAVTATSSATGKQAAPKPGGVSTYSGGGGNRIVLSLDAGLPQASLAFIQFAEALKISGVFEGSPSKAMVDRRLVRAGEAINAELGVIFVGVDGSKKLLLLRDNTGAELRVGY